MEFKNIGKDFGQALKEARLEAHLSQEELAHQSELDRTYVSMLERGIKVPTIKTLFKLATSLSIDPTQLLERVKQLDQGLLPQKKATPKIQKKFPFFATSISCGKPIIEDFIVEKSLSLDDEMIKNPEETFFMKASGDSMQPSIWDGDLLIVSTKKKAQNGSIVIAQVNNEFTVKRYFQSSKGIRLIPDNNRHKEIVINAETQVLICAVVLGITRKL